ncbi:hypothetical protein BDN70DRAFT_507114 [Pholiota conissans]|uniref:Uncharacterized protein n=1 Tax=Pholiota conissans TaxID=109636 RepID=A0A9P5Z585_9AGAR|nr:hypothetical protein BDN70DRAFT_507114 [Pholiota conissans]
MIDLTCLERPIEMHTFAQLEHVVLRWASAQMGWDKRGESSHRERLISTENSFMTHLVEGGRWLLVVHCFDASIT